MRAYKILPVEIKVRDFNLSKGALIRLTWMDWYFSHGKNAEAACRHFSISKSVFYRWKNRFDKYNLTTL
ncbi:MAG: helix-turn-helix domain-containing protein, partial [Candidatus Daviesbacteria bacterium]|nr:helix-turn-helix domain-containing protein [Candidatus Daviesbacteria bacterium]